MTYPRLELIFLLTRLGFELREAYDIVKTADGDNPEEGLALLANAIRARIHERVRKAITAEFARIALGR